jgi:hypothetical protein
METITKSDILNVAYPFQIRWKAGDEDLFTATTVATVASINMVSNDLSVGSAVAAASSSSRGLGTATLTTITIRAAMIELALPVVAVLLAAWLKTKQPGKSARCSRKMWDSLRCIQTQGRMLEK